MKSLKIIFLWFCLAFLNCFSQNGKENLAIRNSDSSNENIEWHDTLYKTIHIYVALCDNKYQGIVPVPAGIGNGQDPGNNLYWGCGFGIRTYFKKSSEWKLVKSRKLDSVRLERLVFKHASKKCYLVADAYDGQYIKRCTAEFLKSAAGQLKDTLHVDDGVIGIGGNSSLVAYIGHDGLMDFQLDETFNNADNRKRDAVILACYSKKYFSEYAQQANLNMVVWTTGLMCPEAYTIHDAITGYLSNESNESIRTRAARAYSKYQKCSENAARNLLVTGW